MSLYAGLFDVFDPLLDFVGSILAFLYDLAPNYAISIMLLTIVLMVVTTPLTLKGTKGMIKMQLLQPELKKIQDKHKGGDRQAMNEELMAFYQENSLNPLGGCLPLLIQMPFFLMMYNVVRGLTGRDDAGLLSPDHLGETTKMFTDLNGSEEMLSFGIDLSRSAQDTLGDSIVTGLPYLVLVLAMIGAQYFQQKQISARSLTGQDNPQQKILKYMPIFFGVISINFPAGLVIYWVTSNLYRIGLQAYITRSLYGHEGALGHQANQVMAEAREQRKTDKGGAKGLLGGSSGGGSGAKSGGGSQNGTAKDSGKNSGKSSGSASGSKSGSTSNSNTSSSSPKNPGSKKKKNRPRRRG